MLRISPGRSTSKVFCNLVVLFFLVITRHAQIIENSKFVMSLQYLKKEEGMKLMFIMQINIKLWYQPLVLVGMIKPAKIN